ncbi:MAG: CHAP domain-containing protein [Rhodoglobus sp.]|uniref:CHAP domain-containing protein n=1 Tax=Salinibacterium sp. G-O1 TaxID=3046208 RepID=UPI0024B9C365|nr:CHAP domain-containing protein [Salinibacterium sp. G-O1]MDJ0336079.1 CHAP domain-containing protein [Salinibacterium sp. G-O1]
MPSSNMDDLFDTAAPGAAVPADAPAAPQQFLTRREMRAAEAAAAAAQAPAVETVAADEVVADLVVTEVAVTPADVTPAAAEPHFNDLLGLSVSVPDFSAGGIQISAPSVQDAPTRRSTNARAAAAPRKLRRAEVRHIHAGTAAPKAPRKHPVSVLATMAVVGGLFAVAGLPAYAISTPETDGVSAVAAIQSVTVNGESSSVATVRDSYEATSAEQIAAATRDDVRAANNAKYLLSGARELGDDYPWFYELGEEQGGGLSELNYYYRQCTDFVAWRINRDAGSYKAPFKWVWSNMTPTGGNASQWKYAWQQHGWPINDTPTVGDVAWFGSQNHVAYVKTVLDGGYIVIEEYNYVQSSYGQRTILASTVEAFLGAPF